MIPFDIDYVPFFSHIILLMIIIYYTVLLEW